MPDAIIDVGGGRTLHVPKSLKGVAVFSFKKLCGAARGAADYLTIAQSYHTVILVGIPKLRPENRNEAARFVTLIDALYVAGDGAFEFERTASRLNEMLSDDWLEHGHGAV